MRWEALMVGITFVAAVGMAQAQQAPKERSGLYLRGGLGFAAGYGHFKYQGDDNQSLQSWSEGMGTLGLHINMALGHTVAEGLALAAEGSFERNGRSGLGAISGTTHLSGGVMVDWWPSPTGRFHPFLAAGVERVSFAMTTLSIGSAKFGLEASPTIGPYGAAGVGWDIKRGSSGSFGLAFRIQGARLTADKETYVPITMSLLATVCTM